MPPARRRLPDQHIITNRGQSMRQRSMRIRGRSIISGVAPFADQKAAEAPTGKGIRDIAGDTLYDADKRLSRPALISMLASVSSQCRLAPNIIALRSSWPLAPAPSRAAIVEVP